MKYVKGAVCIKCNKVHEALPDITTCPDCGSILDITYDYEAIKRDLTRDKLVARKDYSMWRYKEFLPTKEITLSERLRVGWSPLYEVKRLAGEIGIAALYVKDDGINPTGSLKDRASAMAVVKALEAGYKTIACSSTGNAASSLAGNAARAGIETYIFVPERAPKGKVSQLMMFGAHVISVKGSYEDTFKLSADAIDKWGWYNRNAAINPFLMEGKKTVALEIAEQLNFEMTDYVAVSVGDGCTISGVYKGFYDMYCAGLIDRIPRLISVQASGCCPINKAVESGKDLAPMEENTIADSIAVGVPRNPNKAINAVKASNGITVNVSDEEIMAGMRLLGRYGIFAEPAAAAATAGVQKAAKEGLISKDASVVSIVTGSGLKDVANAMKAAGEPICIKPDMELLKKELGL